MAATIDPLSREGSHANAFDFALFLADQLAAAGKGGIANERKKVLGRTVAVAGARHVTVLRFAECKAVRISTMKTYTIL